MANTAPAVVIGAELNGLGVVRSLARGGVRSVLVGGTRMRAAMWSRFCRAAVIEQLHGRSLVDGLLAVHDKLGQRPVLVMADALAVKTVSENRDKLLGAYRFLLPPRSIVTMLQNKARFHEFAEHHELPVPRTIVVKPDTPLTMLSNLPYPVVVKPAERRVSASGGRQHAQFAATLRDAENICRRMLESAGELVVQEWIDGPDSNVCFSLFFLGHRPENFTVFAGRKLASSPERVGDAALCIAAPEVMDALEPLIAKFLDLTEFRGMGRIEFKWDMRQRRYVVIGAAVGHTDPQGEIATLCGINLPLAAYRDEIGLPFTATAAIDRTAAWRASGVPGTELPGLSPSMQVFDGYWRFNDPMPALFRCAYAVFVWIGRNFFNPMLRARKSGDMGSVPERMYHYFVRTIFQRGKASTR